MRSMPSRPRRLLILNLVLVFLLGLFAARIPSTLAQMGVRADGWPLVEDARNLVMQNFVDKPDAQKLAKGAIQGMLESLDDPYAEYISAADAADFEKAMTGSFSGVGCQIEVKDGWLFVASPMEDSPAFNAGIIAGDRVSKVDGVSTHGLTTEKCIKMITGPEGTPVKLDVQRNGQDLTFNLTRAKIVSKSVRGYRRLPDASGHWDHLIDPENKIAYIRMSQFTPTAPEELIGALGQATGAAGGKLNGLILDMRYNPGGIMDTAIEIVDMFVDEGKIMSTKGRNTPEVVYRAEKGEQTLEYPVAMLVNGSSASASEIVAGSLSENLAPSKRAVVIGTRTFGKGLVQSVTNLPHDPRAILKFTTQHYFLPSGKLIQRTDDAKEWGVDPTPGFYMPITDAETTAWLLKRRDWDVLRKPGTEAPAGVEAVPAIAEQHWNDGAWIESAAKDRQLAGAIRTMQAKVVTGDWLKLTDVEGQSKAIATGEIKTLERIRERMGKEFVHIEKRIETLESVASAEKEKPKDLDFWSDTIDLTGGLVEVRDKDGKVIADLRITGRYLERWLALADVEKEKKDAPSASTSTPPAAPKQ